MLGQPRGPAQLDSEGTAGSLIANGRSLAARAQDVINVKDAPYGAKGDTITAPGSCTIAAGSSALNCPSATFTPVDVGKAALLHGSGPAGIAQQGKITGYVGSHDVTVSFTASLATPWFGAWTAVPATIQSGAGSYAPGDVLTVVGGTGVATAPQFPIATTQVTAATLVSGGAGGTAGACTMRGTTGTGTNFQVTGTITGGVLGNISLSLPGSYAANPTNLASEPVTATAGCAGLMGAAVSLATGPLTFATTASSGGTVRALPSNPVTTTTNGSGTGATLTLTGFQPGGVFVYGTDDTAAVISAITAATAQGKAVYFPGGATGTYWLASQTNSIYLASVRLLGDGPTSNLYAPYMGVGSTILISNPSRSAFNLNSAVVISGINFLYPAQDSYAAVPIAYPALFEVTFAASDVRMMDNAFLNPYDFLKVDTSASGSGLGRVYFHDNAFYCIRRCMDLYNGAADIVQFDGTNTFSSGYYSTWARTGNRNLAQYTNANGEIWHIDVGAATKPSIDGLQMDGTFVYGYWRGIGLYSGYIDLSSLTGTRWDSTPTIFHAEGTAKSYSFSVTGGVIYSTNVWNSAVNDAVFDLNTSNQGIILTVNGMAIQYAAGDIVKDYNGGGSLARLTFTGNDVTNFGLSSTPGTYFAIATAANGGAQLTVSGNTFTCSAGKNGVLVTSSGLTLTGNSFKGCNEAVFLKAWPGDVRPMILTGNQSSGTTGSLSVIHSEGGVVPSIDRDNAWDKPTPVTVSACGKSPSVGAGSNNNSGTIAVGTGGITSCAITFVPALFAAPNGVISGPGGPYLSSVTATGAVITWPASQASGSVSYQFTPRGS